MSTKFQIPVGSDRPSSHVLPSKPSRTTVVVLWAAQIIVAVILAQSLFFKFTYAPETQYIFESRGGRPAATLVGIAELVSAALLLTSRRAAIGAALALAVIGGAIFTHLTSLGIAVKDPVSGESDGGLLFGMALTVAAGSLVVLRYRWPQLPYADRVGRLLGVESAKSRDTAAGGNLQE